MQTLTSMFTSTAAAYPDRPFFVTADQSVTYAEFEQQTGELAANGLTEGQPVGILLPSGLELALTYWAAQRIGAVAIPLNPMFRAPEIAAAASLTRLQILVTDSAGRAEVGRIDGAAPDTVLVWSGPDGGPDSVEALLKRSTTSYDPASRRPDDPVCMFFTSGTTGRPKAVVQTQLGQQSALTAMFVHNRLRYGSDVVLNVMPLFNNFGASGIMNTCVFAGATMVLLSRWDVAVALDLITRHRVTMLLGTPTIYVDMCEQYDPSRHDLSQVRTAITAGAAAPPALIERFHAITGVWLSQIYGATETSGIVIVEPHQGRPRPGSIGQVVGSAVVRILDDDGKLVPVGQPGEIVISGDIMSPGYFEDPEAQDAHTLQGWRSGDIGYVDEGGYYFLVDRKKDMVICGGNNIYPAEVEAVIAGHPAVVACAVVGVPGERRGEIPVAVVVPRRGGHLGADSVTDYCRERIAAYKVPRAVYTSRALPLGPTGKVLKAELRNQVIAGLVSEATTGDGSQNGETA
ncbi:AMP-dependent synthetase [Intrasporangium chromatireducens Q5-1]|uniref:AMP-dependent synthetase n=1 Tax=Intrasporangium chromatireducens Q5-1 TaxID=584657 RepID=W9GND3_9MICO|nr:AMP-binding protein [Intrasporangium chromatireducens]EWT07781.1 AMP-dependent synthetase [Intrasporangium chromatireducens Q5-1]